MRRPGLPGIVALLAVSLALAACGDGEGAGRARFVTSRGVPIDVGHAAWKDRGALFTVDAATGAAKTAYALDFDMARGLRVPRIPAGQHLVLRLAGCRDVGIPVPPPAEPIVVPYGIPVRLRVETDGALPAAPYELQLELAWRGPGDAPDAEVAEALSPAAPTGWLDARDGALYDGRVVVPPGATEVRFCVSTPAPYRVVWSLQRVERQPGQRTAVGFAPSGVGTRIVVEDRPDEQTFVLLIDARQLAEALTVLGR